MHLELKWEFSEGCMEVEKSKVGIRSAELTRLFTFLLIKERGREWEREEEIPLIYEFIVWLLFVPTTLAYQNIRMIL